MKNIVIVGSGGFAKEVAFLIDEINNRSFEWKLLGFIDDRTGINNGKYNVIHDDMWLENIAEEMYVVFGIGNPGLIKKLYFEFSKNPNIKFPNLIHPNVVADWERVHFGHGNIICAGNIFTTDISVGSCNIFNLSCTIGHDSWIGNFNVINPSVNISGGVRLGDEILLGTGSQILQYVEIDGQTIIGASALVTKNIREPGVYIGSPARRKE